MDSIKWQLTLVVLSVGAIVFKLSAWLFSSDLLVVNWVLLSVAFIGGVPLVLQIFLKLFKGDFGADFLAAIAIITAIVLQEYLAATLIVLMLSGGQVFESFAVKKASSALVALADRMPSTAHRKQGQAVEEIPLMQVTVGDFIVIYPHEVAPVDGIVVEGHGHMDESYLTGEPYGVPKIPGSQVISGATNGNVVLVIRATNLPQDSRYSSIMKVMQDAEQHHPALRRLGDQIGAVFTPFALIIAFAAWYFTGDSIRFLAVLVIATPCPLLIAIPVTIISAISAASSRGIVIKDPIVLERLPTCRTAIFDKTGTLTYGRPELTEIEAYEGVDRSYILQLCASLERYSTHPLATAVLKLAKQEELEFIEASSISEPPGQGLTGQISGKQLQITDRKHLLKNKPELASVLPKIKPGLECVVLLEGNLAAILRFQDILRLDGKSFISHLSPVHQFTKTMIVSGDRAEEVEQIAHILGIDQAFANQTPEQKVEIVRAETAIQPTLYIGDGINDAPALLTATVGLAFGYTSNITSEAGGAVIFDNSLAKVDELIHISANMRKIALQSAIGGMLLSIIGMAFAALGYITPVNGAIFQEAIDVLAILNALRLTWGHTGLA